jgi:hypothetical protein
MYAKHSIKYDDLNSYFLLFSIWDEKNVCISWDETVEYAEILGLDMVPTLYDGVFEEDIIKSLWSESIRDVREGYVVRLADSYPYINFNKSLAKFVRSNHVDSSNHHWMFTATEKNGLIS